MPWPQTATVVILMFCLSPPPSCPAVANAWEDKQGRVHLFACHFPEFSFGSFNDVHK